MKLRAAIVALFAVLLLSTQRAEAAATVMCSPTPVDSASQRQIITAANSFGYTLNGQGCTVVQQADILTMSGLGFSAGPPFGPNILTTTGVLTGTTSVQVGTLPAGTYIQHIIVQNATANAVTGGINFGSSSGGSDIVNAIACGANCLVYPSDASLSKRIFSTSQVQPIYATAATSWNNANVTISVIFGFF